MLELIDSLWLFIGALLAIIVLGIIAGFSPTLYITQIGIATTSKRARSLMVSLMMGVLAGIILLSIFFQFFQLDTLRSFIDSTVNALRVSVIFNLIVGSIFILGGFWYIHKKPNRIKEDRKATLKLGYSALITLGFFRTFVSISGATATFLASGIISSGKVDIVTRIILTIIFLAAVVAPFILILITMQRHPKKIQHLMTWFKSQLYKFNYKLVIGAAAIILGSGVLIFNLLSLITY